MKDKDNGVNIKLIGNVMLAPFVDGHQIKISDNGDEVDITFFQIIPTTANGDEISGIPVVHLRLSMTQLDALIENIAQARNELTSK